MKKIRIVVLPAVMLALGVWLLVGCLYIPTFNATVGGKDATRYVGDADSKKKLTSGNSSRDNVRRVLGKPFFETSDGRFLVYSWKKQKGLLVYPVCFSAIPNDTAYAMTLEFGADGVMTSFDVEHHRPLGSLGEFPHADRFAPFRVKLHQQGLEINEHHPERIHEFRAATQRSQSSTR